MELIFYEDAAKLLGITVDTLRHAVSRGELTRGPQKGHYRTLIKDQVLLFKGRRLSYKSLSADDKARWLRYADAVKTQAAAPTPVIDNETIRQIVRKELLRQEREEAERKAAEAREKEERFRKDNPFLYRGLIPA